MATKVEPVPNDTPPEPVVHKNLAVALAAFQADLPVIRKNQTAEVVMKSGGKYAYDYADLTDVSEAVLPALAKQGLAWVAGINTVDGSINLEWALLHGESDTSLFGSLAVGRPGQDWQSLGSAITYARRYALVAATGVAPGGDDNDGATAAPAPQRRQNQPQGRPPAPTAPIAQQSGPLPADLYRLSSLDSLEATQNMYRQARAAGHLRLTIGIPDENGTIIETAFEDVLTQIGERFKSPATEEASEQAAIAAHEAETAQDKHEREGGEYGA